MLETNAFEWLAQQDRRSVLFSWLSLGTIGFFWLGAWCAWPRQWPSTFNFFLTAMLLLMIVGSLELHAAARRLGESRHDGTLELLLTTPLTPEQIVDGQLAALEGQFRPVRWVVFGTCMLMALGGFFIRRLNVPGAVSYLLVWSVFFTWCFPGRRKAAVVAMWVAAITGRPAFALFRSQGSPWRWVWILFNLRQMISGWGRSATNFPSGSMVELVIVGLIVVVVLLATFSERHEPSELRAKLIRELRTLAQTPVPDPHDPRFKQWKNVQEPFPA